MKVRKLAPWQVVSGDRSSRPLCVFGIFQKPTPFRPNGIPSKVITSMQTAPFPEFRDSKSKASNQFLQPTSTVAFVEKR